MEKIVCQICFLVYFIATAAGDCRGRSSVILNGTEYRMFFTRKTSQMAQMKCNEWGEEWKSASRDIDLITSIGSKLQTCLREMIESNNDVELWSASEKEVGYFIGGGIDNQGWYWNQGGKIPLRDEEGFNRWADAQEPKHKTSSRFGKKRCMSAMLRGQRNISVAGDWVDQNCNNTLYYICQRDVPKELVWGFSLNNHAVPPSEWANTSENASVCSSGARQSPVDIPLRPEGNNSCGGGEVSTVLGWGSDVEAQWKVQNTGRMVKIDIEPKNSLFTMFRVNGTHQRKHYVDHMLLKWGSNSSDGSEHSINGAHHAGELQIFHQQNESEEVQALAFIIEQRTFQPNKRWAPLISHIIRAQEAKTFSVLPSPSNHIRRLLEDSSNIRSYSSPDYIMGYGVRYHGSLTHPPCSENVIWTVHPRPIDLSHSQFQLLRQLHMEGKEDNHFRLMRQTTREIQSQWNPSYCKVETPNN